MPIHAAIAGGAHLAQQFVAVHARHVEVGEDHLDAGVAPDLAPCVGSVFGGDHVELVALANILGEVHVVAKHTGHVGTGGIKPANRLALLIQYPRMAIGAQAGKLCWPIFLRICAPGFIIVKVKSRRQNNIRLKK